MVIRDQQMLALEEYSKRAFENRMIDRLRTYFPKPAEQLGEPQLRLIVQFSEARAEKHALTHERSVALYLDLMMVLGSKFDQDPQIPWAAAILADRSFPTQADRIDLLHSRGWEYGQKISADFESDTGFRSGLIQSIGEIRYKSAEDLSPQTSQQTAQEMFSRLHTLFPAKTQILGEEGVRLHVERAFKTAAGYGISNCRGVWLFSALMFVLGTDFDTDPQFPWASLTLTDKSIADPILRTDRLFAEAREALKRWWDVNAGARA